MSDPSYNTAGTSGAAQGTTAGSNTGREAESGIKDAYGATEKLRTGINSFFDNTIQPSAERDAAAGSTANHRPGTHDPSQNLYTQATTGDHSTSGTTSTGSHATGAPVSGPGPTAGKPMSSLNFAGGHTSLDDLRGTRAAMERWQQERKKIPGTGSAPGLSKAPGLDKAPGLSKAPGLRTAPGLSTAPGLDKAPGLSKAPGLKSAPGLGSAPGVESAAGTRGALERLRADRTTNSGGSGEWSADAKKLGSDIMGAIRGNKSGGNNTT